MMKTDAVTKVVKAAKFLTPDDERDVIQAKSAIIKKHPLVDLN